MKLLIQLLFLMVLVSCEQKNLADSPVPPVVSILSISPDTIQQFQDSVIVILRYEDMNGDLGNPDADVGVVEIKDSRLAEPDWFHVQPLAPLDVNIKIEGTLRIKLNSVFLLGNGTVEPVNFTIRMKDRAGNFSAAVQSETLYIVP